MTNAFNIGVEKLTRNLHLGLLVLLIPWTALTLPGMPIAALASHVWYVTFISHVALILAALSVVASTHTAAKQVETAEIQAENANIQADNVDVARSP